MSDQHTPGPWELLDDNYSGEHHFMVVDRDRASIFDSVNRSPAATERAEKFDMQLAAAAPELLESLRYLLNLHCASKGYWAQGAEMARAAIAKATGVAA